MQETRQKIIDAAILIFNDDQSAPLEKVAEKAAVTRRTLHRYFKDRHELLTVCSKDIRKRCSEAMAAALDSSDRPLTQLEQLLYAALDCGAKYAFFHKLHGSEGHQHHGDNDDCTAYDTMHQRFLRLIMQLQDADTITRHVTPSWIHAFFTGVVNTALKADAMGEVAKQSQKQFAWFSFSKGIGV